MTSVIDIGGKQYNVKKGDVIAVDKLDKKENEKIDFDNVLMLKDGEKDLIVGNPYIKDAKVEAKVVKQVRDNKVFIFKFKRRKNYKRFKGHKQPYTMVEIKNISVK